MPRKGRSWGYQMISSRVQFSVYGAIPADSAGLPDVWLLLYRHRGGAVRPGDLSGFPIITETSGILLLLPPRWLSRLRRLSV